MAIITKQDSKEIMSALLKIQINKVSKLESINSDLLEACEGMVKEWIDRGKEMYGGIGAPAAIFRINEAIKKAKGE